MSSRADLGGPPARPRGRAPDLPGRVRRPPQAARGGGRGVRATSDDRLRLLIKAQVDRKQLKPVLKRARKDRGSRSCSKTSRPPSTCRAFADCDVCLTPSRWEGLGLPLYRGDGLRDADHHQRRPADERGRHRRPQRPAGRVAPRRHGASGIDAKSPDVDDMAARDRGDRRRRAARAAVGRERSRSASGCVVADGRGPRRADRARGRRARRDRAGRTSREAQPPSLRVVKRLASSASSAAAASPGPRRRSSSASRARARRCCA